LSGGKYTILPDRIEAGTFLIGAAMTRGSIKLNGICPSLLEGVLTKLRACGANIEEGSDWIKLDMNKERPKAINITTGPFPGFPTDLQAQWMALNTVAKGTSSICEEIFDSRFMHAYEMQRMGANLEFRGGTVIVHGRESLMAAPVIATDLRASASLVLAGLVATGRTLVDRIYHIDRGYSFIEEKMMRLGASIRRMPA
jgi:UDP-N-acetylglucosamine 1-carboxyvinyltransferase